MISLDMANVTGYDAGRLLKGSIIPRPVAFITSLSEDHVLNGAPFSYFTIVSTEPPLIAISVQRTDGKLKDTSRNILSKKSFVVHVVDEKNVEQINETAATLPPDVSEVELAKLTIAPSLKIPVAGVREAKIRMECVLEEVFALGDKDNPACDLIIGRVVQFYVDEDVYENGRINASKLEAISRLAGSNYAKTGSIFEVKRPE